MQKIRILAVILPILAFFSICRLSGQSPVQTTVKTEIGANDPTAHAYLSKTRKWLMDNPMLDIRFRACMATSQSLKNPQDCQRGSMLISGEKFRLIVGTDTYYCNGNELWAYSAPNKEVSIFSYDQNQQQINPIVLIRDYRKYYRAKYIRQETLAGSARNIIDLSPLTPSEILKVRLFLNHGDNRPFRIEMYFAQDRIYVYEISECKPVSNLSDAEFLFDLKKFPDVMVNDMR